MSRIEPSSRGEPSGPPDRLFEAVPVAMVAVWSSGGELQLNAAARALFRLEPDDRVRSLEELAALWGASNEDCALARALAGETVEGDEIRVDEPHAPEDAPEPRTWSVDARPIREGEAIVGAVATIRDVTTQVLETEMGDELLGRAAHDLRTPLTALKASAQLVGRGLERLDPNARARTLQLMLTQVEKLAQRIDDVVDAARIRRGRYDVEPVDLDLPVVLREIADDLVRAPGALPIELDLPAGLRARGDLARLRQILTRAAADAAERGNRDASLRLSAFAAGDAINVTIETRGASIKRTTRRLAMSILDRLGGTASEEGPTKLVLAFTRA
ncbi:MAG: PAS domain-containing protein [Deltaproteobacteria bacterium]|nr:PAS domain-containing protein [Deltaproteobacteria bacterium]